MAYTIVDRLKKHNHDNILQQISEVVNPSDKDKRKIHQVFELSFDCKEITSQHFLYAEDILHTQQSLQWRLETC